MAKDYYEILGVSPNASQAEIKQNYKKLVKKYHPDRHQNNPLKDLTLEKFKEIKEAYEVLGDKEKRKNYDRNQNNTGQQQTNRRNYSQFEQLLEEISTLLENRQWSRAKTKANQAINLESNHPLPYAFRALANLNLNQATNSLSDFREAENLGAEMGWFFANYGVALNEAARFNKAIKKLKKAIEIDGQVPNYIAHLAIAYESSGNTNLADRYWNKLKRIDPNNHILQQRKQVWNNSRKQYNQTRANDGDCCEDLCCFCLVLKCCFDCC